MDEGGKEKEYMKGKAERQKERRRERGVEKTCLGGQYEAFPIAKYATTVFGSFWRFFLYGNGRHTDIWTDKHTLL